MRFINPTEGLWWYSGPLPGPERLCMKIRLISNLLPPKLGSGHEQFCWWELMLAQLSLILEDWTQQERSTYGDAYGACWMYENVYCWGMNSTINGPKGFLNYLLLFCSLSHNIWASALAGVLQVNQSLQTLKWVQTFLPNSCTRKQIWPFIKQCRLLNLVMPIIIHLQNRNEMREKLPVNILTSIPSLNSVRMK